MSAQSNLEIVQEIYAAFQRGDMDTLLGALADDVVWKMPNVEGSNFGGTYEGPAGVGKFFQDMAADQEITKFEVTDWIADGAKVVVLVEAAALVRATGKTAELTLVHVCTVKDGKIAEFLEFYDTALIAAAYQAG